MNGARALPDADARRRAATDFASNLVVLAGAGTGKTSLLIERVLNALGSGAVTLDALVAITFTEKAAGEMRSRLAAGLERLRALARGEVQLDAGEAADRAFAWLVGEAGVARDAVARRALEALERLDRARVSTIHAFCSELLREHPFEAGVDPDFAVDSGGNAAARRIEAWERFLARELGPAAPRPELWRDVLESIPLGPLRTLAFALAGFDVPRELLDTPAIPPAREVLAPLAHELRQRVAGLLHDQPDQTERTTVWLEELVGALDAFLAAGEDAFRERVGATRELRQRITTNRPGPRKSASAAEARDLADTVRDAAEFAKRLLEVDDAATLRALEALAPFAREFREELLRQGLVDFDGLIGLARDLLRERPDVRRAVKRRFRMLLVDEFQDTDPAQHEIVLLLGEREDDAAADAWATRLAPGRLFVVGDPKQSIYRFRGADYASYRRAVEHIRAAGGTLESLVANFRSVPGIVDPVNAVFANPATWAESPYQPPYEAIAAVRDASSDQPSTEVWTVEAEEGALAHERREAEGRVLAEAIEVAVAAGQCRYRDVHVLFRAFGSIGDYLRPLRERGIPFVVDGGREFLARPEVQQLMAALRTLALPGDEPALLAFLRSPAGAASDVELAAYAAEGGRWDWRQEPDHERHERIAAAFALLRALRDETRWLPADATIRRVLERTRLLPLGAAAFEGAQRVANLRKLAESAAELARDGRLSLAEVIDALEAGRLEDLQTDRPLSDDAAEAVRITSIHRMKGLENAWVFVPDLARQDRPPTGEPYGAKVLRHADGSATLALKVKELRNGASLLLDAEHEMHERAEEVRVFYVALTRAKARLVALVGPARQRTPWLEALAAWGYAYKDPPADAQRLHGGRVLHRRCVAPAGARPRPVELPGAAAAAVRAWDEACHALVAAAEPPLATPSGLATPGDAFEADERATATERGGGSRDLGRATGIVLHRLLEGFGGDPGARASRLERLCAETADAEGVDAARLRAAAAALVESFAGSDLGRQLGAIEVLGRELPMLVRHDDGRTFRGSIDLLYRDADGAIVVADYKTDREDDADALRVRYRPQLAIYANAVRQALGLAAPPRTELWLLRSGQRVVVD